MERWEKDENHPKADLLWLNFLELCTERCELNMFTLESFPSILRRHNYTILTKYEKNLGSCLTLDRNSQLGKAAQRAFVMEQAMA